MNTTNKCGECLYNGYKSCIASKTDHPFVTSYSGSTTTYNQCCNLTSECKDTSEAWTCTSPYNNTLYAKYACPFNIYGCGSTDSFTLGGAGANMSLKFTIGRGDVCFYKILNTCGIAKIDLNYMDNSGSILAEFIEF